jgi:hypothetical protein
MKRKLTLIPLLILVLSLIFSFCVGAYDAEVNDTESTDVKETTETIDTYEEDTFFTVLYEGVKENSDKILSALAFLGSLIIAFMYKKGLFPFIEKALASLSGAVVKLGNETKKNADLGNEFLNTLSDKLETCENIISGFSESLKKLELGLVEFSQEKGEREKLKFIMKAEVEMLNEIIMASSLPQYQKDRAGECFMKMKEELKAEEIGDEARN